VGTVGIRVVKRGATGHGVVIGECLEPVDAWTPGEDRRVVVGAQSESETWRSHDGW